MKRWILAFGLLWCLTGGVLAQDAAPAASTPDYNLIDAYLDKRFPNPGSYVDLETVAAVYGSNGDYAIIFKSGAKFVAKTANEKTWIIDVVAKYGEFREAKKALLKKQRSLGTSPQIFKY